MEERRSRDAVHHADGVQRPTAKNLCARSFLHDSGKETCDVSMRTAGAVQAYMTWVQERQVKEAGARFRLTLTPELKPHLKQLQADPRESEHDDIGESGEESSRQQSEESCSSGHLKRPGGVGEDGFLAPMNKHRPFKKHRLLHGFERICEDQEGPALEPPQHMELTLPAALAQFCLGQNYGLASRIALPGKSDRIVLMPRQYEYENFGLPVHWRDTS
jgi:hypothetical protein